MAGRVAWRSNNRPLHNNIMSMTIVIKMDDCNDGTHRWHLDPKN